MDLFSSLGVLCILAIIFYLLLSGISAKDQKDRDNIDLAKYIDRSIYLPHPVDSAEGKKELRRILSDPEIRKKAEAKRQDEREKKQKEEDLKRRELIIKRTFSYKYENILYEVFAPYATKRVIEYDGQKWELRLGKTLDNVFVISEISRIAGLPKDKATELFEDFVKNDMLEIGLKHINDYTVLGKWVRDERCSLGNLLLYDWNIISNEDMNLSKWIEMHPDRESKDSVDKRRGVIKECISFSDYVKREGGYSVEYDSLYVLIKVNNGHCLYLSESQIKLPLKNYQYRLKELVESMEDQLYVNIDDEQHILVVKTES